MDFQFTEEQEEIKKQVRALCSRFPDEYWRERDETGEFPWDFYQAFADGGWLGITIPKEYGGSGFVITKARESKKMLILTRTTPFEQVQKKTMGMSLFFADIDPQAVEVRELHKCGRKAIDTNMLFIDNLYVPKEDLIGEEGKGFYYILDGINPERVLVAAECIGMGKRAIERAVQYARERVVFDRPIGMNQGIQFPLADSCAKLETAELMVYKAAWLFDNGKPCGKESNIAKYMAAEAACEAADRAMQTHGGYGYIKDYDVERYWRAARLFRIAPVSQEMVLNYVGEHVLGLPKS